MENISYVIIAIILFLFELAYISVAKAFQIVDIPNSRSSHKNISVRGGGIIFPIVMIVIAFITRFNFPFFFIGLILISIISVYDDIKPLSSIIRLLFHLIAVSFLFNELEFWGYALWIIAVSFILVIGTINAYNFMDGINGMIGGYSLITCSTLYFINERVAFISEYWLLGCILSILVFNFFNFRAHAYCFAGDIGSVSMAYIILFFMMLLIIDTGELKYGGFLLIYGIDTITTIVFRIYRKENILKAHRAHFYQYLANVKNWPHLKVSTLYAISQLLINILIVFSDLDRVQYLFIATLFGMAFVWLRFKIEGRGYLLKQI